MIFRRWLSWLFIASVLTVTGCTSDAPTIDVRPWAPSVVQVQEMRQDVTYLASDPLEGRGVGTHGLNAAADFIAARFASLGLRTLPGCDGYFQPFQYSLFTRIGPKTSLTSGDQSLTTGKDFTPLPLSAAGDFAGDVVMVGYGITDAEHTYDDYAGLDVKGKIVVVMRYEPHDEKGQSRFTKSADWSSAAALSTKASNAAEHGAAGMILINPPTFHGQDYLIPAMMLSMAPRVSIPVLQVKDSFIDDWMKRDGNGDLKSLQASIDGDGKAHSRLLANIHVAGDVDLIRSEAAVKNVVGYLPGSGPHADEYVVVGAHYDHLGRGGPGSLAPLSHAIHHGADDNASGTAAVLDIAERMTRAGRLDRSVIFICFTAEEEGLIGSAHFVAHPPVPLNRIVAMLNLDMVGRLREEKLYIGGAGTATSFDPILAAADSGLSLHLKESGPYIGRGGYGPSDHMSFAEKKIPVLFLFTGMHSDYHTPTDTSDKVNYTGMDEIAEFGQRIADGFATMPMQAYITTYDSEQAKNSMMGSGGGNHASLGVVPDYASEDTTPGVRITGTVPGSAAAKAGLQDGDKIIQIDKTKMATLYDLSDFLARAKPGDKVHLVVIRNKQQIEMDATLGTHSG